MGSQALTRSTQTRRAQAEAQPRARPRRYRRGSFGGTAKLFSRIRYEPISDVVQRTLLQLADHARLEAERIKQHRKEEDAAIFGSHGDQVSRIAASFTVRPPASESRESTTVHIRSSYPDGRTESPALRAIRQQREGRPISMPNPPRPKESIPQQRQSPAPQFSSQRGSPASRHSRQAFVWNTNCNLIV